VLLLLLLLRLDEPSNAWSALSERLLLTQPGQQWFEINV
jgi:hypothetical protein